jgi:UDP-N-acetylglucosamine--N-acetylmuramyl-(pentapeptide) pyrophosphoryl-undecaprenol N-acetylglucosamine transferase
MKILLTGGGSGGHITPLRAVAKELKQQTPEVIVWAVCEKNAKFAQLLTDEPAIDAVYQVAAGKYRRYSGLSRLQKMLDVPTLARNVRDLGRVCKGYVQARRLLKRLRPDGILIKGGFVGVPIGLAAAHLHIPFITHDSDTIPGLANRLIARWAYKHATGMPAEFYDYPPEQTVYTGVPVAAEFIPVTTKLQAQYRRDIGLEKCTQIVSVIGGSQGGAQLNEDVIRIVGRLMQQYPGLGIIHIVGPAHEQEMEHCYSEELLADERRRVVVKGFAKDAYRYTGAADVVVSRASATVVAELAVQGKTVVLVPGQLAGDHQGANARHLAESGAAYQVPYGDSEGLYNALHELLDNKQQAQRLADGLSGLAKPHAAKDLAQLLLASFEAKAVD